MTGAATSQLLVMHWECLAATTALPAWLPVSGVTGIVQYFQQDVVFGTGWIQEMLIYFVPTYCMQLA